MIERIRCTADHTRYAARLEGRRGHRSSSNALNLDAAVMSRSTSSSTVCFARRCQVFHDAVEFLNNGIDQRIVVLDGALKQSADTGNLIAAKLG
jgi:hypothetical protein